MFSTPALRRARPLPHRRCAAPAGDRVGAAVASEPAATYDAAAPEVPARPTAEAALAQLDAALATLAQVDWSAQDAAGVNAAAVAMQRRVNQVQALALRPLAVMQRRETYGIDGAVTAASWLRNRTHMDPAAAARLCTAARRLRNLPLLRQAFAAGDTSLAHVTAITEAAIPQRYEAIRAVEQPLVELAVRTTPRSLHVALRRVRDIADPDGTDAPALHDDDEPPFDAGPDDPRLFWRQHVTLDGLVAGEYLVDPATGEALDVIVDAFSKPDPPDTPLQRRRSPAQRRLDAVRAALMTLLDAGLAPTVQGNKAHLLLMIDLLTLMGRDQAAVFAAELRRTGRVSPSTIARLGINAKITPVLTMGPYRVVAVGRTHRTLPAWLRPMLEMLHRRCRGPDCDRPASWCEAHHEEAWIDGGETDLNATVPLCPKHHDLVTHAGWTVTMDRDTGICTWTAPDGRVINTYPR